MTPSPSPLAPLVIDALVVFLYIGVVVVMILFVVAFSRFVVEYYMPKFLLVARAHSISITTIFVRVMTRK